MSQTFRDNILKISLLFFAGAFLLCASTHIDPQASLDASYYKILAQQLDAGKGFKEPFIWQHLNDYQHIEHEIDYWMPLGIIIYHIAFKIFGDSGGIGLNILIWAVLCVLVYSDVYKQTTSRFSALIAFITLLFGGRIIFFLLTTDNIAFYGLLGYLLFKTVDKIRFSWPAAGVISGIAALTRIDGLIITAISGILVYLRTRSLKTLLAFVAIVLLIVMPWMIRNKISTGIFWQSNYKAIFMTDYEDFFRPEFSGSLKNYFRQGLKTIIFQKFDGLKASFFDFFVIPAFFIFIPLWLAG
ncbi:MAG: hypothetical protein EOM80_15265, partial [Erysipelotrichia bacterium]|nr:hypothetical protein [Erysipelotrichia bacterium]